MPVYNWSRFLAWTGRKDQPKVVQEVLADLKKGAGRYFISKHCDALELLEIDSDHCKRMFANQLTKL